MHIVGDLVATPANYEMVTSFLLRFVVQRLKTRKGSLHANRLKALRTCLEGCILAFLAVS